MSPPGCGITSSGGPGFVVGDIVGTGTVSFRHAISIRVSAMPSQGCLAERERGNWLFSTLDVVVVPCSSKG